MSVEHLAIAFTLILIDLRQRRIVEYAVLPVAAFHFQRRVHHRLTAPGIDKRSAVNMRGLRAKRIQALPRLPGQNQQRQQNQHKRERDQLTQRTGEKRDSLQG